jgi:hypothetical protein
MNSAFALSGLQIHFYSKKRIESNIPNVYLTIKILSSLVVHLSKKALLRRDY